MPTLKMYSEEFKNKIAEESVIGTLTTITLKMRNSTILFIALKIILPLYIVMTQKQLLIQKYIHTILLSRFFHLY